MSMGALEIKRIAAAIAGAAVLFGGAAYADKPAEAYMQKTLDEAFEILTVDGQTDASRNTRIYDFIDQHVDARRVALFALGLYRRQASDTQLAEYNCLFADYVNTIYKKQLDQYSGERLTVTGSIDRRANDIIVFSEVTDAPPSSQFAGLVVNWRLYKNSAGKYAIVDVGADDIWLAIEQRGQFASVIADAGAGQRGVDELLKRLAKMVGPEVAARCKAQPGTASE